MCRSRTGNCTISSGIVQRNYRELLRLRSRRRISGGGRLNVKDGRFVVSLPRNVLPLGARSLVDRDAARLPGFGHPNPLTVWRGNDNACGCRSAGLSGVGAFCYRLPVFPSRSGGLLSPTKYRLVASADHCGGMSTFVRSNSLVRRWIARGSALWTTASVVTAYVGARSAGRVAGVHHHAHTEHLPRTGGRLQRTVLCLARAIE